ncbi:hypothetical protein OsccyDRAFT_1962 [Leptolyngbyaceae cyanobacterium JSC-12]|nr:hypothetical protein OsccyDRAFT_1962 [Leptolyngbyaceae cyanobacterium JSC-12]
MKLSLSCPSCGKAIADLHHRSSQSQIHCPACGKRYGVLYGKLSQRSSIQEALFYLKSTLPSFYKRHYTLQITTADRTLRHLQFSIPGKADVIPVNRGDILTVLYTMQGYVMKKLVAIANHTTGKQYVLPNPIPSSSHHVAILLTIMTGFVAVSFLGGLNLVLTALFSAISVLAYLKFTHCAQLTTPPLEEQTREAKRLLADQRLMAQQRRIVQRISELRHERQANQVLIEQLETLKQKMSQVDQTLYSARIYRATGAINILKQQIANNQRLVREYERTLKMIEIEIDTSWIADQLPDAENFTRAILERLAELKEIEDQNQTLKFQLAAYEEVKLYVAEEYG